MGDIIVSLVVLGVSCYLYAESLALKEFKAYKEVGPDFWPQIILTCLILTSAALTITNLLKWKRSKTGGGTEADEITWWKFVAVALLVIMYVFLLKPLGFLVATPFLIAGVMLLIGRARKTTMAATVVGIMVLVYIAFGKLLYVPLPRGHGIFRDLSIYLGL